MKDLSPSEIAKIIETTKAVLVDCWAPWCGPCRALSPILEELDEKYSDNQDLTFLKLNTQEHRGFAASHGISAIPCVLIFKNGMPAEVELNAPSGNKIKTNRIVGLRSFEEYESVIEQLVD